MAETPFRAVSWAPNELIGKEKMDQVSDNVNWLRDHSVRGMYTLPGGTRLDRGLRIAAGRVLITRRKSDTAGAPVRFGNFFSVGSQPIVTTGIVAEGQRKIFVIVNGYGQLNPDHRGFQVGVEVAADRKKHDRIARSFYVTWQALGY